MKNKKIILVVLFLSLILNNCQDPFLNFNPKNDEQVIVVPDEIEIDPSINDPQETGVACDSYSNRSSSTDILDVIDIPDDLPITYDLSENMPPVRSQGSQGSCVAWATTYYMKSYQEKIQEEYKYETYEDVMSPAFVYNQAKVNINCLSGSSIETSLEILKTQGVNTWKDFPYSEDYCTSLPSEELLLKAKENLIKEYFKVEIVDSISAADYTLTRVIKTLVYQKNPIVISMDFGNLIFNDTNGKYQADLYSKEPIQGCGHAVLIVGYDDLNNAFKIVNSWGTDWGNAGYAWINYNFFVDEFDPNYQQGLDEVFIAYDEE
jgi:C1A family cysteine protease